METTTTTTEHRVTGLGVIANLWEAITAAVVAIPCAAVPQAAVGATLAGMVILGATADHGPIHRGHDVRRWRGAGLALIGGGVIGQSHGLLALSALATIGVSLLAGRESWAMLRGGIAARDERRAERILQQVTDALAEAEELDPAFRLQIKPDLMAAMWDEIIANPDEIVGGRLA